jgi:hypothetical protein
VPDRQHHHGSRGRHRVAIVLSLVRGSEQIPLRGQRVHQASGIRRDHHASAQEAQALDRRRPRVELAVDREIEHRGHRQRDDREKEQGGGVGRRGPIEFLRAASEAADEERCAEHQQQVADDAAGNRGFDQADAPVVERDDRDDQLGGVAERRVEKSPERRTGPACELLGAEADQARQRHERDRGGDEDPRRAGCERGQRPRAGRGGDQHVQLVAGQRFQHASECGSVWLQLDLIPERFQILVVCAGQQIEKRVEAAVERAAQLRDGAVERVQRESGGRAVGELERRFLDSLEGAFGDEANAVNESVAGHGSLYGQDGLEGRERAASYA